MLDAQLLQAGADDAGEDLGVADLEVDAVAVVVVLPGPREVHDQDPRPTFLPRCRLRRAGLRAGRRLGRGGVAGGGSAGRTGRAVWLVA